jgi:hypothetical protein
LYAIVLDRRAVGSQPRAANRVDSVLERASCPGLLTTAVSAVSHENVCIVIPGRAPLVGAGTRNLLFWSSWEQIPDLAHFVGSSGMTSGLVRNDE